MSQDLRTLIEQEAVLWILVRPEGGASVALPHSAPPMDWIPTAVLGRIELDEALYMLQQFCGRYSDRSWAVVASALKSDKNAEARAVLRDFGQTLSAQECEALVATGMDKPFGEWADPSKSDLFRLRDYEST